MSINIATFIYGLSICILLSMGLITKPIGPLAKKSKALHRVCFGGATALLTILLICGIVKALDGPVVMSRVEVITTQQEFPAYSVTLEQVGTTTVAFDNGKVIKAYPASIVNNTCTTDSTGRITKADKIQIIEEQTSMRENVDFMFMTLYRDKDPEVTTVTIK